MPFPRDYPFNNNSYLWDPLYCLETGNPLGEPFPLNSLAKLAIRQSLDTVPLKSPPPSHRVERETIIMHLKVKEISELSQSYVSSKICKIMMTQPKNINTSGTLFTIRHVLKK